MHRTLILSVVAVCLQAWAAPFTFAQTNDTRTITVNASSDVRATPDRALLQLGVETQGTTAQQAMAQNSQLMDRIVTALLQVGIPMQNLQTSTISLTPVYKDGGPQSAPILVGFRASNVLAAEITELSRVGPAIDAAVVAGANQIQGISFRLGDDTRYRLQALTEAGKRAGDKAAALAAGLGVKIGAVDSAVETGVQVTPVERAGAAFDATTPVLPGQLVIHADVQVRFRIAP